MAKPKKARTRLVETPLITVREGVSLDKSETFEHLLQELESLGFAAGPHIRVAYLANWPARLFLHAQDCVYGILYDDSQYPWIDLFSVRSGNAGTCFSVTNANAPLLGLVAQRPAYFASIQYANLNPSALYSEFLLRRTKGQWDEVCEDSASAAYQIVCEADVQWQKEYLEHKADAEEAMKRVVLDSYERVRAILERDELHAFRRLLKKLALPKDRLPRLPSSLTAAAGEGNMEVVKMFLARDWDIEEPTGYRTPLTYAASRGQLEAFNFLLQNGARASIPEDILGGPITAAAENGHIEIVRILNALVTEEERQKALKAATVEENNEIIKLLGGNPISSPAKRKSETEKPKGICAQFQEYEILMGDEPVDERLIGKPWDEGIARAIQTAATPLLKARLGEEIKDEPNSTLNLAVATGSLLLIETVLSSTIPKEHLLQALIDAAANGSLQICKVLLRAGADAKSPNGFVALISAVEWGHPDGVRLLLDAGADPKARTESGQTAKTAVHGPFSKEIATMLLASAMVKKGKAATSTVGYIKAKNTQSIQGRVGAKDFREFVGHPEWALAFVQSDPATVCAAVSQVYPGWVRETGLLGRTLKLELPHLMVFRLKNHQWTVLVRSVGWLGMDEINGLANDATKLSRMINVRVVTYLAEGTSACETYEVFEKGRKVEEALRGDGNVFKSSLRKKLPGTWDQFPEASFRELGIYVPCCWLDDDGYETKLIMTGIPEGSVESLDAFLIR